MTAYWALECERPVWLDDEERAWGMPGITCRSCGNSWGRFGAALPSVSLTGRAAERTRTARNVRDDEWRDIAREVRPQVRNSEPLFPGLEFGPISGRLEQPVRFGMHHHWGLFLEESVKAEFQSIAPEIPLVPTALVDGRGGHYYELEVRCDGEVLTTLKERCVVCGYVTVDFPKGPFTLAKVPERSLFRDPFQTTQIFSHERLLPFLKRELGAGTDFIPAPLAA